MSQPLPPQHPDDPIAWVQVMLTIERPGASLLAGCNRQETFDILLKNAQQQREVIVQWIQAHDLADEVLRIGPPTGLNLLFVQCTAHAAAQLAQVPGVIEVALEDELHTSSTTELDL